MSLSECTKCGGHIPLGPDASNVCEECGAGVFALPDSVISEGNNMSDADFLRWIHERLVNVHGENPSCDYMHRLRAIINSLSVDLDHMMSFIDAQINANASAAIRSPDHATWSRGVVEGLAIVKRYIEERRTIARGEAESQVRYGCHCDLEPHMAPDTCVIDDGRPQDCVYASKVVRKELCEYWRVITTA